MNGDTFSRLHSLRMDNDAAGYRQQEMRPRFAALGARRENGTAPRAVSAFNLFQTPVALAARMAAKLDLHRNVNVLEPSAGLGRLLDAVAKTGAWDVTAIEVAPQCAAELFRQERAGVNLLQRDFLTVTPQETGLFDAVIMNPPFHMRADIRHILHAKSFLKPGGRLVALCLDTPHRTHILKPMAATWEQVPAGEFGKEGTRVATVMLTIQN